MNTLLIDGELTLAQLRGAWAGPCAVELSADRQAAVQAAQDTVAAIVDEGRVVYGVNTGFGLLAHTQIATEQLAQLQTNLVLSHATGVGEPLEDALVRLIMVLKIASLSGGHSGIDGAVLDLLRAMLAAEVYPVIPGQGSVGASGDLAPLAHLAASMLGAGDVRVQGKRMPARDGLRQAGLEPICLGPKAGLALLNGTQVSTALALAGLFLAENVLAAAVVAGAMSVDGAKGSDTPFDARIHRVRRHRGQQDIAATLRKLLADSEIRSSMWVASTCRIPTACAASRR